AAGSPATTPRRDALGGGRRVASSMSRAHEGRRGLTAAGIAASFASKGRYPPWAQLRPESGELGWPGGLAPPRTRATTWRLDCFGFGHIWSARGWAPSHALREAGDAQKHAGEDSNPDLIVLETT